MQQELFGDTVTGLDGNSKNVDPISSVEAGEDAVKSGIVKKHQDQILAVMTSDPQTNMQIAGKLGFNQNQVTRRMTELQRRKRINRGPFLKCPVLGRKAGTWVMAEGIKH